jgi:hypothetical protein
MNPRANELVTKLEADLLVAHNEMADLRMVCDDEVTRRLLRGALTGAQKLREHLQNLLLDACEDEDYLS